MGSNDCVLAYFADLDPADIWSSGIEDIVTVWANKRDTAANGSGAGVTCGWTQSGGVISFHCEANSVADVFVLRGTRNQL
jgi:hypothetical protein